MPGPLHRLAGREDPRARVGLLRGMYSKVSRKERSVASSLWSGGAGPAAWYLHSRSSAPGLRAGGLARRWLRSLPAHIGLELGLYLLAFYTIHLFYRLGMTEEQQDQFKDVSTFLSAGLRGLAVPLTFMLGFYVKQTVARWWGTWEALPWPDVLPLVCSSLVAPSPQGRRWASRLTRYCLLSYVLCLRRISKALQRMFPSDQSLTDSGLVSSKELSYLHGEGPPGRVWWLPLSWAMSLIKRSKQDGVVEADQKILIGAVLKYHGQLEEVDGFDHMVFPPVYRQVVAFAVYAFFGLSLVAEQVEEQDWVQHLPGWLILKFVFFFGWLEVAEAIQHPWGTDTDDFQVCDLVSRHLWALGRGLGQGRGPPEEEVKEVVEMEEEKEEEETEQVQLNSQDLSSKYSK